MSTIWEDTLRAIFGFIGASVQFILGLIAVIVVTACSLSGEILDDISTYKDQPIDWFHVAKADLPPIALAAAMYIRHRQMVADALAKEPPKE